MKKFFIVISGIYLILVATLIILVYIVGLIVAVKRPDIKMPHPIMVSSGIIFVLFASWPLVTGIGLILKKNWSRYCAFVLSTFGIFMGLVLLLVSFVKPVTQAAGNNPQAVRDGKLFALGFTGIFFITIPLFYIIFLSRKSVKELFVSKIEEEAKNNRPFGVTFIAFLSFFGSVSSIMLIFLNPMQKFPLIGSIIISGLTLKAYFLIYALLDLYIGIGLLKLRKAAWIVAICIHIYSILLLMVNVITMSEATLSQIPYPYGATNIHMTLAGYRMMMCVMLIIPSLILIYLISRRNLFLQNQTQISINA